MFYWKLINPLLLNLPLFHRNQIHKQFSNYIKLLYTEKNKITILIAQRNLNLKQSFCLPNYETNSLNELCKKVIGIYKYLHRKYFLSLISCQNKMNFKLSKFIILNKANCFQSYLRNIKINIWSNFNFEDNFVITSDTYIDSIIIAS